jgi:hypothetical protein
LPETSETRTDTGLHSYALACRRAGDPLIQCGGTWWREVRPCFFRPFLPFLDVPSDRIGLPFRAILGGYQYPCCPGGGAPNSCLAYVAFEGANDYALDRLKPRLRGYVRSAQEQFAIRTFANSEEFKACAHPTYLEFYSRTNYGYQGSRTRKPAFDRWADAQFSDPGLVALGAWAGDLLVAASLSRVVGPVWVYSSFFASNEALRSQVANLMLHHARGQAAAAGVTTFYAGMRKFGAAGESVDEFYLRRGATVVRRPAVLHVNPVIRLLLPSVSPGVWSHLRGDSSGTSED